MDKQRSTAKKGLLISTVIVLALTLGFSLISCSSAGYLEPEESAVREDVDMVVEETEMAARKEPSPPGPVGEEAPQRHIIRRGSINLAVEDSRAKAEEIRDIVREIDGLIDSSSIYEIREGQYGARMTIRVPEESFEEVMGKLETLGKATDVRTELEDVTDRYIDLQSRLKNLEAQESRLTEILDMAETVEEVLEVEKELQRVRGEIESMSARLDQLKDQITYSTIDISLREEAVPTGAVSPYVFDNLGKRIAEAFTGGINFLLNAASMMIIVFSAIMPALIILAVIALVIWLLIRRQIRRKNAALEQDGGQETKESV
ncbi:MAG: DUF4349 domain-containing protein [Bacillota bacterium]